MLARNKRPRSSSCPHMSVACRVWLASSPNRYAPKRSRSTPSLSLLKREADDEPMEVDWRPSRRGTITFEYPRARALVPLDEERFQHRFLTYHNLKCCYNIILNAGQFLEPAQRGGKSHEHSFWMAWPYIARWREQEVDALKAALKQATFCHWRKSTAESRARGAAIYCECCEMWLGGHTQYEHHKLGNKHRRNNRIRWATPSIWPLPVYRRPETS